MSFGNLQKRNSDMLLGQSSNKSGRKTVRFNVQNQNLAQVFNNNGEDQASQENLSFLESEDDNKLIHILQRQQSVPILKINTLIQKIQRNSNQVPQLDLNQLNFISPQQSPIPIKLASSNNKKNLTLAKQARIPSPTFTQNTFQSLNQINKQQDIQNAQKSNFYPYQTLKERKLLQNDVQNNQNRNSSNHNSVELLQESIAAADYSEELLKKQLLLSEQKNASKKSEDIFQYGDKSSKKILNSRGKATLEIQNLKKKVKVTQNGLNDFYDQNEEIRSYLNDKDLVKSLDTFEMKVAPTALHIFAENLNSRIKNTMFTSTQSSNQPMSQQLKILSSARQATSNISIQQAHSRNLDQLHPNTAKSSGKIPLRREFSHANVNMNNLNLIMKDPGPTDPNKETAFEKKQRLQALQNDKDKLQQQQKEIEKYMSMETKDLYSEEARRQLTKYKIYRPKSQIKGQSREALLRSVKTTNMIASDRFFETTEQRQMPHDLKDDEIVATQMDLYLTINLNENLQKARLKRKKDRMMEEVASKLTKIQGFVEETFKTDDINERVKIEGEILQEYRSLQQQIEELRVKRTKLFSINTSLHHQLQNLKQQNKQFEEELKQSQLCSKSTFENKMKNMDRAHMIKDLVKMTAEKESNERMIEERKKRENRLNKARDLNTERIYYVEQEMEILKLQLLFLVNVQKEHYLRLLKEGKDTRQKGLLWIIQCLQCELEVPVIQKDMMPRIIDDRSKEFIMELAQKDFQLLQLQQKLSQLKQEQQSIMVNESNKRNSTQNLNFDSSRSCQSTSTFRFSDKGFIPIKQGQAFQKIMDLKNQTLKDIWQTREETKRLNLSKQTKTMNQILEESNQNHASAFGFQTVRQQDQKLQLINSDYNTQIKSPESHLSRRLTNRTQSLISTKQIQRQIECLEKQIEEQLQVIDQFKMSEIKRLVRDYQNHYSELRKCLKTKDDLRKLFLCLFGDTSWEVEFMKLLKQQENDKKNKLSLINDLQ